MKPKLDLDAYFKHIGYKDSPKVDLNTLRKLQYLHLQNIPFENLNPLLRLPVKLTLPALQQKITDQQRGGYCFEQNLFFLHVLKSLGYKARGLTGRVVLNQPVDTITGRTHMLILIQFNDKSYICDVGFGGQVPTGPLLLAPDLIQQTPHENYRLRHIDRAYLLQAFVQDSWQNLYVFDTCEQHFIDYKIANWYTSTHPDSHFTSDLIITRIGKERRYILNNHKFTVHRLKGKSKKRIIQSKADLLDVMEDVFNLIPPKTDQLEALFR